MTPKTKLIILMLSVKQAVRSVQIVDNLYGYVNLANILCGPCKDVEFPYGLYALYKRISVRKRAKKAYNEANFKKCRLDLTSKHIEVPYGL